jgi:hypothetical protein
LFVDSLEGALKESGDVLIPIQEGILIVSLIGSMLRMESDVK